MKNSKVDEELDPADAKKTIAISRRHVLGTIHFRCEHIESIPVFVDGDEHLPIGFVDEAMGIYADAFVFHLEEQTCKRLAAGQFTFSFDYSEGDGDQMAANSSGKPVKLSKIVLVPRKGYEKPLIRAARKAAATETAAPDISGK